jgi:ubiquinone/menaquinone biosynthesis C-methylase UbiE
MSDLGRKFDAYQAFVLGMKLHWTQHLYPQLQQKYICAAEHEPQAYAGTEDVARLFAHDTDYAFFAWLERHLQSMKYSGLQGLIPTHEQQRTKLERWLDAPLPAGLLELDPELVAPRHFTGVDIHQHVGGVCGDSLAGVIYERGARSTTPLLDKDLDLHFRFAATIASYTQPTRILDLGCGFGKSTQPLHLEFYKAQVLGIDVSAPCLKLAARITATAGVDKVRYAQKLAQDSKLKSASFDLVSSTMLLHEMPPAAIKATLAETFRLLEPGGYAIHLDFLADADPFKRFIHYGHSRRNNEPYMAPLNEMDLVAVHKQLGFESVEILPFEESPGALGEHARAWRFPWALIVARKA